MFWSKKKREKLDLLSLSDSEKTKVIEEIRQKLQGKIREEKRLRHLREAETITVKGKVVYEADEPLKGLILPNKL